MPDTGTASPADPVVLASESQGTASLADPAVPTSNTGTALRAEQVTPEFHSGTASSQAAPVIGTAASPKEDIQEAGPSETSATAVQEQRGLDDPAVPASNTGTALPTEQIAPASHSSTASSQAAPVIGTAASPKEDIQEAGPSETSVTTMQEQRD